MKLRNLLLLFLSANLKLVFKIKRQPRRRQHPLLQIQIQKNGCDRRQLPGGTQWNDGGGRRRRQRARPPLGQPLRDTRDQQLHHERSSQQGPINALQRRRRDGHQPFRVSDARQDNHFSQLLQPIDSNSVESLLQRAWHLA